MPNLYIITGSNGAGKSSVGSEFLPDHVKDFVFDGDKLFMQKRKEFWNNGIKSHKECKKLAIDFVNNKFDVLVDKALKNYADFAYEGHFTNDSTWDIPKKFKKHGFYLTIIFFGLTDTDLSQLRVIGRSKEGGHYVNPIDVTSNFYGNLEKLDIYYNIFDEIKIFDTSTYQIIELVHIKNNIPISFEEKLPNWFIDNLKSITNLIYESNNYLE